MRLLLIIYYLVTQITIIHAANQYLGCFIDQIGNRDLSIFIGDYEQLTPKQCILACQAQNFLYAAIQYGNECRCGQQYGKYGQVSDEECDHLCSTAEKCGGDYRNSVYHVVDSADHSYTDSPLLSEKLVRVKRAVAVNDSTQTTDVSSISTPLTNSTSWNTVSLTAITSQSLVTTSSSSSMSSSINSNTNTEGISITTPTMTETSMLITIISNSTSSISVSQSSTNLMTNIIHSTETSSMYSITSIHTDTTTVSSQTSSQINTFSSYTTQSLLISTLISASTSLNSLSSNSITSDNPASSSSMMITESPTISSITSTYSTEIPATISEQSSSISSTPSASFLSINSLASNSTSIDRQVTIISSLSADITAQTSVTSTTISTTTVPSSDVIYTIILVPSSTNFDPNDNATRETIRTRLSAIINLAFECLNNSSYPNCTQPRQRIKRALCPSGYDVDLISINQLASTSTARTFSVQTTVRDPCNQNAFISPAQVKAATDQLSPTTIRDMLGYDYDGNLIRTSPVGTTDNPTSDPKLWLIGAVLGPVAFAALLICVFCYLHYKCRPRPGNRPLTKVISNAPVTSPLAPNFQTISTEKPLVEKDLRVLIQNDPLGGSGNVSARRLTPIQTDKMPTNLPEHSISTEVPMAEIRRQNDVERWRNKLRLQEKFQQSSTPNTNRSEPYQYDNRAFEHDPSSINIQPANEITSNYSPHSVPKKTEIAAGRTKLHRLLDEVLDQADSDEVYNPDSDLERQKRRRQRRRINSISTDQKSFSSNPPISHTPVIPQVTERPDPSLVHLRYNHYEAGDRAHDISRLTPVELKPKYDTDDQRSTQYSSRSNPPLYYDDTTIADRAATATDAYANPKRFGKARLETDREAAMRHDGGRVDRRQHQFMDDAVHIDTIPKNRDGHRVQARTVWVEPDTDHDSFGNSDYLMAKRSVANTRNIISSIHDELQQISGTTSGNYHA